MTKTMSERQVEANRVNALKSTGPRTAEGKKRSSGNALRHGLRTQDVVLRGGREPESAADFERLVAEITNAMRPRDGIEQALVQRIAACLWRSRRVQRFEVRAIQNAEEQSDAPSVMPGHKTQQLAERIRKLRSALSTAGRKLAALEEPDKLRGIQHAPLPLALLQASGHCDPPRADLASYEVYDKALELAAADVERLRAEIRECEALREQAAAYDARRAARRQRLAALPREQQLMRVIRYESMLDRQLHRALAEFRRRRAAEPHDEGLEGQEEAGRLIMKE